MRIFIFLENMARTLKTGRELPKRFIYCIGEDGCRRAFGNADPDQPKGNLAWRKMCLAEWLAQLPSLDKLPPRYVLM